MGDLLTSTIAELGENMVIRRFTRYMVGDDIAGEKKTEAAE